MLDNLKVGQVVEVTGKMGTIVVGEIKEVDLEAEGFWLSLETEFEGMEDWDFPNSSFIYTVDVNKLIILSK